MENLGYYNGKYGPLDQMSIPMNDRVCWFGDGVYDAGPARAGKIFALDEHVDRFFRSAEALDVKIPCTKDKLKDLLYELLPKVDGDEHFVYFQCTRGTALRLHNYDDDLVGNLWVMILPAEMPDGTKRIKLRTEPDTRYFHCNIKTVNLIPNVMSSHQAAKEGVFETVYYREGGRITECSHCNVSIIKDGEFWTAPCDELILPGIARAHLIKACKTLSIPVHEEVYYLDELFNAEEIIVSSASNICLFAESIDDKAAGGKRPDIAEAIRTEVHREFSEETAWKIDGKVVK